MSPQIPAYYAPRKVGCLWCRKGIPVQSDIIKGKRMHDIRGVAKILRKQAGNAKFAECLAVRKEGEVET
jgi:hypothetical protein